MHPNTPGAPSRHSGDPDAARRLLDLRDIAEITGTSERMARRIIQERRVPTVKVGRYVRVWSDDLTAYLAEHTRPAAPEARAG